MPSKGCSFRKNLFCSQECGANIVNLRSSHCLVRTVCLSRLLEQQVAVCFGTFSTYVCQCSVAWSHLFWANWRKRSSKCALFLFFVSSRLAFWSLLACVKFLASCSFLIFCAFRKDLPGTNKQTKLTDLLVSESVRDGWGRKKWRETSYPLGSVWRRHHRHDRHPSRWNQTWSESNCCW